MKKYFLLPLMLLTFVLSSYNPSGFKAEDNNPEINWLTFEQMLEKQKENPKKVFIDVYTDWCGWCKVMDKKTFTDPSIVQYMNDKFYAVKLNAEMKKEVEFKGKNHKFVPSGRRGIHELALAVTANKLGGYPTVSFLDEEQNVLTAISSYLKPEQLKPILHYFGEDGYKKHESYEEFLKEYNSQSP